ncbi:hypothetical protein COCNU_scaffold002176G000010 [Cocos nucifera]|nr:hypothetical protein [Cocos nucifera]
MGKKKATKLSKHPASSPLVRNLNFDSKGKGKEKIAEEDIEVIEDDEDNKEEEEEENQEMMNLQDDDDDNDDSGSGGDNDISLGDDYDD